MVRCPVCESANVDIFYDGTCICFDCGYEFTVEEGETDE